MTREPATAVSADDRATPSRGSERMTCDVAVVGASLAGCTVATLLGRLGLGVVLIEMHADPRAYKRICTHFIQASGTPVLERLGIARQLEAVGAIRNRIDIWTRWGWIRFEAGADEPLPFGYNIRRSVLDPTIRECARSTPGVELLTGWSFRELLENRGRVCGVVVETLQGDRMRIDCPLVVGADGRQSRVAQLAGSRTRQRANGRFAYFAHYRKLRLPNGNASACWLLDPEVAFALPNDDGVTVLACYPTKRQLPSFRSDLDDAFRRFLRDLPDAPLLDDADRVSEILGMTEMPNISRTVATSGLALVGDAAMASDPLWGVGCGFALQSAEWLADAVGPALAAGPQRLDGALREYRRRHRWRLGGHHLLMTDYSSGRSLNPLERCMFAAAARDPRSARHLHAYANRLIGVPRFLSPRAVGRAIAVNLRASRRGVPRRDP